VPSATRVLASFPCPSCEALLVVASRDEDVVECSQCDQVAEVPAAVRERPDLGQALDYDAEAEVREAIASYVRAAHVGPEARGWLIAGLAIAAGVLGAFTSAAPLDEPALSDWAWGAGVGLVVVMIPFGLVLQFLASRTLTRKLERGWNELAERADRTCPACAAPIGALAAAGRFDCARCDTTLVAADGAVVVDNPPRPTRWKEAVARALRDAEWVNQGGIPRAHALLMVLLTTLCLGAVILILRLG
tara:strand:- start:145 stop:885 length:741 start_codon:yes stop_codon:yes gene_type:complete